MFGVKLLSQRFATLWLNEDMSKGVRGYDEMEDSRSWLGDQYAGTQLRKSDRGMMKKGITGFSRIHRDRATIDTMRSEHS